MKEMKRDGAGRTHSPEEALWVYGYEMISPPLEDRMTAIQDLLSRENDQAQRDERSWTARLVTEERVTHVLIVSDSPEVDLPCNRKLETELRALGVNFHVTVPMSMKHGSVADPEDPPSKDH